MIKVQIPIPEVKISKIKILRKAKEKVKMPPYFLPKGIIEAIIGSTFGALNGINLMAKIDRNISIVFIQFFIINV